jgi:histone H3/H4
MSTVDIPHCIIEKIVKECIKTLAEQKFGADESKKYRISKQALKNVHTEVERFAVELFEMAREIGEEAVPHEKTLHLKIFKIARWFLLKQKRDKVPKKG